MATDDTVTMALRLPRKTYELLRDAAKADDRPISSVARRAIVEWLNKHARSKTKS